MSERPFDALPRPLAALHGWHLEQELFSDFDLPTYVGPVSFMKLPWVPGAGTQPKSVPGVQPLEVKYPLAQSPMTFIAALPRSTRPLAWSQVSAA